MTATQERLENAYAKYAMKFVTDAPGMMPTDARLAEVLAGCTRPPKPGEYVSIREHVFTYLDGRESKRRDAKAALLERIAGVFLGQHPRSGSRPQDGRYHGGHRKERQNQQRDEPECVIEQFPQLS